MVTARVAPCFVQVFDPVVSNSVPLVSVAMSTNVNVPGSVWINHHAGSEGGGLSRSVDRHYLALEGYVGNILSPTAAKPSTDPTVERGMVTLDPFTNAVSVYSSLSTWFGIPPGAPSSTQDNPTGIASTDGTNFWGTGNFAGTSSELDGTLFYSSSSLWDQPPVEVQNFIQAAGEARIINGTLYIATKPTAGVASGVYNFVDPASGNVVPLPWDPTVANPYQSYTFTNLYINWGSKFVNVLNFDMDPSNTVAYGADQTYGIVKFTNNAGTWVQAPYYFTATNIGTLAQSSGNQGCFAICVDFSGTNPVIYATTMENGYPTPNTAAGHQNQNRIIRIVDYGTNPATALVAQTLAVATTTNEFFGGIDFTPDLSPLVASQPASYSTVVGNSATFSVGVQSVYALNYQWLEDGTNLVSETNASLTLNNLDTTYNNTVYQCVATNDYGSVTSAPAILTVTTTPVLPAITSPTNIITSYVGNNVTFAGVGASGTQPFTSYQWFNQSGQPLADDGVKYYGSATASLSISNLTTADSGNYYVTVGNAAGYSTTNVADVLTVAYHLPTINAGLPASAVTFVGVPAILMATESGATLPITNQWYRNGIALTDGGDYSGSATPILTNTPSSTSDSSTNYYIVISNGGGSVTSAPAAISVIVAPAHSSVAYSNQVYTQTFDSLPDPGTAGVAKNGTASGNGASVNSFNNPLDPGQLNGLAYSLANPFDFSYPVIASSYIGGLGITQLQGWYGAADTNTAADGVDGITRFGAQDGDQSTGGVIDFGLNDVEGGIAGTNRSLGLISTSTTGSTALGLKLVNTSTNTLNYINVSFLGEYWRNNSGPRTMSFAYAVDPTADSFVLTSQPEAANSTPQLIEGTVDVPSLAFSFPYNNSAGINVDGTQAANETSVSTTNLALSTPWTPGAALWLVWSINYYGAGSGQGLSIDNLKFSASPNPSTLAPIKIGSGASGSSGISITGSGASAALSFSFTNAPGLSFSVIATNVLTAPKSTWPVIGTVVENPAGSGQYQFTDPSPATNTTLYYMIRQP